MENIPEIKNLTTSFFTSSGEVQAGAGHQLQPEKGESLGIVGNRGAGNRFPACLS